MDAPILMCQTVKPGKKSVHMGVSENSGFSPQIIHFNRDFHYFHHPFWGTPIFGNTHIVHSSFSHPVCGRVFSCCRCWVLSCPSVFEITSHLKPVSIFGWAVPVVSVPEFHQISKLQNQLLYLLMMISTGKTDKFVFFAHVLKFSQIG